MKMEEYKREADYYNNLKMMKLKNEDEADKL